MRGRGWPGGAWEGLVQPRPLPGRRPHRLLQQLLQRVDPLPVASLALDDDAVAEGGGGQGACVGARGSVSPPRARPAPPFPAAARPLPGPHMSGGCRVLTLPAYSRLSSLGMSTGSPSCRSSLWMVHERAGDTRRGRGVSSGPAQPLPARRCPRAEPPVAPLTQGSALLGAQGASGLLLVLREAAAVLEGKVVLHREALQQPAHRLALALGGQRGQLPRGWGGCGRGQGRLGPEVGPGMLASYLFGAGLGFHLARLPASPQDGLGVAG